MLEIDVDIGRLVALLRDEAFEQKAAADRIDLGDVKAIADGRIGGRAAPLRENALVARMAHDVVDGEEIGGVIERRDDLEFMCDRGGGLRWNAAGPTDFRAFGDVMRQRLLLACETLAQFGGVIVGELIEREIDALDQADRFGDGLRRRCEQSRHFLRALQMAFGVAAEQAAGIVECAALADAGYDIGDRAPLGGVHDNVVDGDERQAGLARKRQALREIAPHMRAVACDEREPQTPPRRVAQSLRRRAGHRYQQQAVRILQEVVEAQQALAFLRARIGLCQHAAQAPPGYAIPRIGDDVGRSILEDQPGAGDDLEGADLVEFFTRINMRAHDARDRIAVGDPDPRMAERGRGRHELLRMRGAAQEGKIRGRGEFGVGHPNTPCRNQRGWMASRPNRPSR